MKCVRLVFAELAGNIATGEVSERQFHLRPLIAATGLPDVKINK